MKPTVDEFEFFLDKAWSDGLPVVTPTEARVARMLAGTARDPGQLAGNIPPAMEPATVRTVAIHAVMAGCKPDYLPVVLGGLALMLNDDFNLNGVQGTLHGVAPLMIVNGPYARKIGIHGANGCMANLSVRGVAEKSLQRLKQNAKRRGVSVNRLIADMLNAETGIAPAAKPLTAQHELDKLAGTWSAAEARAFDKATASFGQVDEELWR